MEDKELTPEIKFDSAGNLVPEGCEIMEDQEFMLLPCNRRTQIGSPVKAFGMDGYVRTITFTAGKVRFSVRLVEDGFTTIHNVDSCYVIPRDGDRIDMGFDNYS